MDKQEAILALEAKMQEKSAPVEPVVAPEPVETEPVQAVEPAAAVDDSDNDNEEPALSDGDDATAHPKKNKGVGKRINELTREKHEERRAREQAQAEAAYWQEQARRSHAPEPAQVQGKPTLEAHNYDQEAYFEALAEWKADQKLQGFRAEQQQMELGRKQQEKAAKFRERVAEFEKEVPGGWAEAVSAPFDPSPVMLEVISDSDIGPKIGHYLATHLDEAYSLSQLTPYGQAAALGRIEAELKRPAAPSVRTAPAVSRAPAPAPVIQGGSPSTSPHKMGIEDHIAVVKAQRKAKYG